MASRFECDGCGVAAFDLPDVIDPDDVFLDAPDGRVLCQGCIMLAPGPGTRRSAMAYHRSAERRTVSGHDHDSNAEH